MKDFVKKWQGFICAIIDPWLIIICTLTVFLSIMINKLSLTSTVNNSASITTNSVNNQIIVLLTVLISIFSAIAGSIIEKNIRKYQGEDTLITRGKVSIRSLKLILGNLYSFGRRINSQKIDESIQKLSDLDVCERITILQEEVLSSIENWTDIIPEADVKSQIGVITSLQEEILKSEKEKKTIGDELANKTKKTADEKNILEKRLQDVTQELSVAKKEIYNKTSALFGSTASQISPISIFGKEYPSNHYGGYSSNHYGGYSFVNNVDSELPMNYANATISTEKPKSSLLKAEDKNKKNPSEK